MKTTMAVEVKESIEEYYILDVRDSEEYEERSIEGSHNIPLRMILVSEYPGSMGFYLSKIPKEKIILLYCSSGKRAVQAEAVLTKRGFDVVNVMKYEHAEDFVSSLRKISENER